MKVSETHCMIGKTCILRTYSAGVHIGLVEQVFGDNGKQVLLSNSYRLWSWSDGGLSISALANNGIKGGRLNFSGDICLTEVVEFIPMKKSAYSTISKFVEDIE